MINRKTKAGVILETVLILAGIGLMVKGLMIASSIYKFTETAMHTDGTIVAVGDYNLGLSVQFSESSGGGAVFQQDGFFPGQVVDGQLPVIYDPTNPPDAFVDSFGALWAKPLAMTVLGLVLLLFGLRLKAGRNV